MSTLAALSAVLTEALMAHGVVGMVAVAFVEAWIFPIPPDVLLVGIAMLNPGKALVYAFFCTLASSAGGVFGWLIGRKLGRAVFTWRPLRSVLPQRYVARAEGMFRRHGGLAVAFAALTPIPYKVFTIAAGLFRVRPDLVFVASLAGRGARFFFEAGVVMLMGEHATAFLGRGLGPITLAAGTLAVLVAVVSSRARPRRDSEQPCRVKRRRVAGSRHRPDHRPAV